ncbi:MAG: thioredoxin TrxC [Pseudolabrys sp.]|nr:thioredoxin TrxC [Pseudolabrys sp.]
MPGHDPLIVCPHCSAINRIPAHRAAKAANCGTCKKPLFVAAPLDVDRASLARQIEKSSIPVLVDVWAPWCGPCRMMGPEFAEAARVLEPDVRLLKLNSQDEPEAARQFGIQGIPTMLLFVNGREAARISGAMRAAQIVSWARGHAAAGSQ